jgi:hypothetical protein
VVPEKSNLILNTYVFYLWHCAPLQHWITVDHRNSPRNNLLT